VLVGSSIHVGAQRPEIEQFVADNRDALGDRPTGLGVALPVLVVGREERVEFVGGIPAFETLLGEVGVLLRCRQPPVLVADHRAGVGRDLLPVAADELVDRQSGVAPG
jgi:hypothetical protein